MKNALMLSLALGVALAQPAAANPFDWTNAPMSRTNHHNGSFAKATALAAPSAALGESEKMKGLSRESEDCNYGCVDH